MRCAWRSRRAELRTLRGACRSARWRCPPRPSEGCWIKDATAARRAALQMLQAVRSGATFAAARDQHLPGLAERDRRLAYQLAAGVLRTQADLDRVLALATADPLDEWDVAHPARGRWLRGTRCAVRRGASGAPGQGRIPHPASRAVPRVH